MKKFQRETATEKADLPHEFDGHAQDGHCEVCMAASSDPRHQAWERNNLREREVAQEQLFQREVGS